MHLFFPLTGYIYTGGYFTLEVTIKVCKDRIHVNSIIITANQMKGSSLVGLSSAAAAPFPSAYSINILGIERFVPRLWNI